MKILLDILVLLIIGLSIYIGWKRGFIKTVIGLVGMLLVFTLAWRLSYPVGDFIDRKLVNPSLRSSAAAGISEKIGVELSEGNEEAQLEAFEDEIAEYNAQSEGETFSILGVSSADLKELANGASEGIVKSMFSLVDRASAGISRIVAIVLLLIAGFIALWLIKLLITPLLKMLRIKKFDSVLGGVLGFLRGIVIVLLVAFALRVAAPIIEEKLPASDISGTLVFRYAYHLMGGEKV